jgi:hypothetical protein
MACAACNPELAPAGPRRGEHHFAVRFGVQDCLLRVLTDGVLINDCYEVDVLAGKAWRLEQPFHLCECGSRRAAAYVDAGSFSVVLAPEGV